MRRLCTAIAAWLEDDLYEDPIEKGIRLERAAVELAVQLAGEEPLLQKAPLPRLAALNCMAPFDAALHDAWGAALPVPLYAAYTAAYLNQDLSAVLGAGFAGRYPADYLAPRRRALSVQHVVGFNDALTPAEVDRQQPPPADLPADLSSWIARDRVRYLKLKLRGQSPSEDAGRLIEVHTVASQALDAAGVAGGPRLSVDPNEGYQQPNMMLEMLDRVAAQSPQALSALDYIEQPTPRDLEAYTDTLHAVAARAPVVVDESLDDLDSLDWIPRLGWSGLAVKTCKGHTHSLLAYCWGRHHRLYLTLQDLTNPGLALVHSANFCAHLHLGRRLFRVQPTPVHAPVAATGAGRPSRLFPGGRRPNAPSARHGPGAVLSIQCSSLRGVVPDGGLQRLRPGLNIRDDAIRPATDWLKDQIVP